MPTVGNTVIYLSADGRPLVAMAKSDLTGYTSDLALPFIPAHRLIAVLYGATTNETGLDLIKSTLSGGGADFYQTAKTTLMAAMRTHYTMGLTFGDGGGFTTRFYNHRPANPHKAFYDAILAVSPAPEDGLSLIQKML